MDTTSIRRLRRGTARRHFTVKQGHRRRASAIMKGIRKLRTFTRTALGLAMTLDMTHVSIWTILGSTGASAQGLDRPTFGICQVVVQAVFGSIISIGVWPRLISPTSATG